MAMFNIVKLPMGNGWTPANQHWHGRPAVCRSLSLGSQQQGFPHVFLMFAVCSCCFVAERNQLVGGFKHFHFSIYYHILGIVTPLDFHIFQRGYIKPPTSQILRALWESRGLKPQISVGSHWILVSWKVGWFRQNHTLGFTMVFSYIHELSFLMCLSVYPIEAHDKHIIRNGYIPNFFNSRGSRTPVLDQFRGASRIVRVCQWAIGLVEWQFRREFL